MATDRDRLNRMNAMKRDQKQGLQQILEPSASAKLSSAQGGNQAQQKTRRQTIYTRTELLNRSVPTTQKNTVKPQTPLLAGPGNATTPPTMPPRQRTCLGLSRTLTRMRTVIDLKPYPSPVKKTPNELNIPQLDFGIVQPKGSKIPVYDRSRNRERFLEQRIGDGSHQTVDKSPNQKLTRMRTDLDFKVKPSHDWRFPESEGTIRPSRLPVLNNSRYRECYSKQRKEVQEPKNKDPIKDVEITDKSSQQSNSIPLPEDPEELPLSKPLSLISEEMKLSPAGSPEHGIGQSNIPESKEPQQMDCNES